MFFHGSVLQFNFYLLHLACAMTSDLRDNMVGTHGNYWLAIRASYLPTGEPVFTESYKLLLQTLFSYHISPKQPPRRSLEITSIMDDSYHSSHPQQSKQRDTTPRDGPPQLSRVDRIIDLHHGSSTAIDATPQRLQESKQYPIPSLSERIVQLQTQSSILNHEVAYYRDMVQHWKKFQDDVMQLKENLEEVWSKFSMIQEKVGYEWAQLKQGGVV
jgi:hypothetical protein